MKKYTMTSVDKLNPGDTFLKEGDLNEIVYTVLDLKCHTKGKVYVKKGDLKMTDMVDVNESIIFLSHG
jgi:hypothetical protein